MNSKIPRIPPPQSPGALALSKQRPEQEFKGSGLGHILLLPPQAEEHRSELRPGWDGEWGDDAGDETTRRGVAPERGAGSVEGAWVHPPVWWGV